MCDPNVWDKPIMVPEESILYIDEAIKQRLPKGTLVKSINASGASYWARTAKIEAVDANGEEVNYFIKTINGESGREQAYTEFASMAMFYNAAPELVTRPIASGPYSSMPDMHFILYEFFDFKNKVHPVPVCEKYNYAKMIADMHIRTRWPGHGFGLELPVFGGNRSARYPRTDSWARTYAEGMREVWAMEMEVQGYDEELDFLEKMMLERVIPRLLKPLQADGRELVPSLVHGDLWEGNSGIDPKTGMPKIFDSTPMWAPAEYELGPLRPERHQWYGDSFIAEYEKWIEYPEPKNEARDRLELYALRFNSHASSLYKGRTFIREVMREDMRKLYTKFGEGYEAWEERQARLRAVQQRSQNEDWKEELTKTPGGETDDDTESVGDLEECA